MITSLSRLGWEAEPKYKVYSPLILDLTPPLLLSRHNITTAPSCSEQSLHGGQTNNELKRLHFNQCIHFQLAIIVIVHEVNKARNWSHFMMQNRGIHHYKGKVKIAQR